MPNIEKLIKKQKDLEITELIDMIRDQEKLIAGLENKVKEKDEIINRMIGIKEKGDV